MDIEGAQKKSKELVSRNLSRINRDRVILHATPLPDLTVVNVIAEDCIDNLEELCAECLTLIKIIESMSNRVSR